MPAEAMAADESRSALIHGDVLLIRGNRLHPLPSFALLFTALFLLHAPLLRLPYFWDEAGYYIPAARDLLLMAALGLRAVFRLGRYGANLRVAVAATASTALYPVFFTQSSMAHAD